MRICRSRALISGLPSCCFHSSLISRLRHALALHPAEALVDGVAEGQEGIDREHAGEQLHGQRENGRQEGARLHAGEAFEAVALVPQDIGRDGPDDGDLDEALDELDDGFAAEHALEARHRRHAAELRLQGLEGPQGPVLDRAAGQGAEHHERQRQENRRDAGPKRMAADGVEPARIRRHEVRIHQEAAQVEDERRRDLRRRGQEGKREAAEDEQGVDLDALGDVAALDRLLEFSLGRFFCAILLLGAVSH